MGQWSPDLDHLLLEEQVQMLVLALACEVV